MSAVEVTRSDVGDQRYTSPAKSAPAAETPPVSGTAPASALSPAQPAARPRDAVIEEILEHADARERFIPVTRQALMERLTRPQSGPASEAQEARRFFRYLDYWRQAIYSARLLEIEQTYEPFNPDSDLLVTRKFTAAERATLQSGLSSRLRAAGASQLHPHRSRRRRADPDQRQPLRPRPARRPVRLRRADDLLSRRHASAGQPPRRPQTLPLQGRVRRADLPATLRRLQAEAGRACASARS